LHKTQIPNTILKHFVKKIKYFSEKLKKFIDFVGEML